MNFKLLCSILFVDIDEYVILPHFSLKNPFKVKFTPLTSRLSRFKLHVFVGISSLLHSLLRLITWRRRSRLVMTAPHTGSKDLTSSLVKSRHKVHLIGFRTHMLVTLC